MKVSGLYVITDETLRPDRSHEEIAAAAIAGGAGTVQLRDKHSTDRRVYEAALAMRAMTRRAGVLFIVNNRVDIAKAVDADGVHVGASDLPVSEVRRLLGRGKLVGASAASMDEALEAVLEGADHLGVGPIFATATKPDAGEPVGLETIRQLKKSDILPVVAIGGIDEENIASVAAAGADAASVISAVVEADDMVNAARALAAAFASGRAKMSGQGV